jgi:hypothetical protein
MFYAAGWDGGEEVDDWETDTDAINTETITSGKSAVEVLGTVTTAAEAAKVRRWTHLSVVN